MVKAFFVICEPNIYFNSTIFQLMKLIIIEGIIFGTILYLFLLVYYFFEVGTLSKAFENHNLIVLGIYIIGGIGYTTIEHKYIRPRNQSK